MIKKIKYLKLIISLILLNSFMSCGTKELDYSKNTTKNDTIYIYYKGCNKNEISQKHINDSAKNYYQIEYKFIFKYRHEYLGTQKHYNFTSLSHRRDKSQLIKISKIEKDKEFLKEIKGETFTYRDLKNKSDIEINKFYNYNRFKTVFLIDKNENKKNKIYLKKVYFGSNYPKIQ